MGRPLNGIYLDSCAIIYFVEGARPVQLKVQALLSASPIPAFTSRLSLLECRVKPLRDQDPKLIAAYQAFFSSQNLRILEIDPQIIETATQIRVTQQFKSADAIHLASAVVAGASRIITGDKQLKQFGQIPVELV